MMLQTVCATGIRVSELRFFTVEGVVLGVQEIHCKGKIRKVLIPSDLQKQFLTYIGKQGIKSGIVFRTSGGKPVDRSNFWREMKAIAKEAGMEESRVFPHNLRCLFAQLYYETERNLAKLADILGHSGIETTRLYVRVIGNEHRKQLERMGLVQQCINFSEFRMHC